MERRNFLRSGLLISGLGLTNPLSLFAKDNKNTKENKYKKAKNIIFMISDGMSIGTMNMANTYQQQQLGKDGTWMQLYKDGKVCRALMDTASASSIVTDSAAASSSFGGGFRVPNGSLNMGAGGVKHLPIWQKFKAKGKKTGCVTTVTITHATPAGFCINADSRNAEPEIAIEYADQGFDVLMGGGDEFFNPSLRTDKKDVYSIYSQKGYQICKNKHSLKNAPNGRKTLGVFSKGALPYTIDSTISKTAKDIPSLAEMTTKAIDLMKDHKEGFVLQVEAGKVDWAAHANDIGALIHDQIAFDDAIQSAMDFAEKDGDTLVIITTDHGNANPGILYGKEANNNFNHIAKLNCTNEWLLNSIDSKFNIQQVKELVNNYHHIELKEEEATKILGYYTGLEKEDGLYNYRKIPFKYYAEVLKEHISVGWISMNHTGDYVELAMYGPGSELLEPFVQNIDLHYLMLTAAHVENKF